MADLKKYVLFLDGKKIYSKRLKAGDQNSTFHHVIDVDYVSDGKPKAKIEDFDVKVGEAPPAENQPPVIATNTNLTALVSSVVTITAAITDVDGTIADIEWKQISVDPQVQFVVSDDKKTLTFHTTADPAVYVFEVTAKDDDGDSASKQITVKATTEKPQEPTEPPKPDELTARLLAFADNDTTAGAEL